MTNRPNDHFKVFNYNFGTVSCFFNRGRKFKTLDEAKQQTDFSIFKRSMDIEDDIIISGNVYRNILSIRRNGSWIDL